MTFKMQLEELTDNWTEMELTDHQLPLKSDTNASNFGQV